jgi:hypothetical protein
MPTLPKSSWTEADLIELLGQSESIRREFKSGRMFDNNPDSKWTATISSEVSAFANTEGGELFLGIDEDRKSKPRVATSIDGVPIGVAPERLQQLIEGNLSPHLPGIRVHRVLLSSQPTNRGRKVARTGACENNPIHSEASHAGRLDYLPGR